MGWRKMREYSSNPGENRNILIVDLKKLRLGFSDLEQPKLPEACRIFEC
jgi:hypothetical protein